jgi:hypothetical protein
MSLIMGGICIVCYKVRGVVGTTWIGNRPAGVCKTCTNTEEGQRELKRAGEDAEAWLK